MSERIPSTFNSNKKCSKAKTPRRDKWPATPIVASGRSDFANQVNNVLCFPFVFRGALNVGVTEINEAMKRAAAEAIAMLARTEASEVVAAAYGGAVPVFGPQCIIPKPFDPRLLLNAYHREHVRVLAPNELPVVEEETRIEEGTRAGQGAEHDGIPGLAPVCIPRHLGEGPTPIHRIQLAKPFHPVIEPDFQEGAWDDDVPAGAPAGVPLEQLEFSLWPCGQVEFSQSC
ncbi:malic enzyme-like NAD(P)-binding protein [Stigmatella ashevillena]|uniref:malic enzyme-like NAD(P)-binding protein n=1 Tax=Stigmatella ashevillensis TaxID=2995309 RepID=UPI0027D936E2|nr:malic enzyme-like NAD(P)-binding protein [Stigmatella ashevillena]